MARFTFNLPDIGEGIAEAELVEWHVKVGDMVEEDDRLADVMTDKATVDLESPVSGKVLELAGAAGDTIAIGGMLVVIETDEEVCEAGASDESEPAPGPKSDKVEERIEVENSDASDADDAIAAGEDQTPHLQVRGGSAVGAQGRGTASDSANTAPDSPNPPAPSHKGAGEKILASPAVRKRAKDLGVDLAEVRPAEDGRLRHGDLDAFLSYSGGYSAATPTRADEEIKVIGMRRRIAENMAASKRNIPHFTYVEEVDVTDLEAMRAQLNGNRGQRPKLTILPLLITAICKTLPDFPMINARYDDEGGVVTRHGAVHMGMAAQTEAGLMVPVIRDAQAKNLYQLADEIARLAEAARTGSAKSDELSGGTLTITSLGPLGGIATTPVINRPEVAIIGPNKIVERPMYVADGMGGERIEKRKLMNISISCDHRVVDGYDAASFVQALKTMLETPVLIVSAR